MGLARDDVERALLAKGFEEDAQRRGADHRYFRLYVAGRRTPIWTKTSHGSAKYKELGHDLVKRMSGQMKLTKKHFEAFVECSVDGPAYLELLRASKVDL